MNPAALDQALDAIVRVRGKSLRRPGRVSLDLRGHVAELVIDNPPDRHALTFGMMEDLGRAVKRLRDWEGTVVVLRASTMDGFCSGGHLDEVRESLSVSTIGAAMGRSMTAICDAITDLPQVTVALITGPAVGGGAELATATDHRLMTEASWIQFRQAALGIGTGWGGARRLLGLVGRPTAVRWLSTSAKVGAKTALSNGFADRILAGDPKEGVAEFIKPVLALPPEGVRAAKRQIVAASQLPPDYDAEARVFVEGWGGPAHRKALDSGQS